MITKAIFISHKCQINNDDGHGGAVLETRSSRELRILVMF